MTETQSFSVRNPTAPYTLRVRNAGIASARVTLNGRQVLGPAAFNPNVDLIEVPVMLQSDNVLSVELRSAPGSSIVVEIEGLDDEPPAISATTTPLANAFGWHNQDVTVAFICGDATSAVVSCPSPVRITEETNGHIVSGEALDAAGNRMSTSVTIRLDKTPPLIVPFPSPLPNAAGWNNTDVMLTWECSDNLSGIRSCQEALTVQTAIVGQPRVGVAEDFAGNTAHASIELKIDKTPPTIVAAMNPPPNGAGWHSADMVVDFSCADDVSSIASCSPRQPVSTEGRDRAVTGLALDLADNRATSTVLVSLDKTAPSIETVLEPLANAAGWHKTDVSLRFECSDGLSGIAECTPPTVVTDEGANQVVTGAAMDFAGHRITATASVSLDRTPPALTLSTPTTGTTVFTPSVTLSGTLSDALSGIESADCNGVPAAVTAGALTCVVSLTPGQNLVEAIALDNAGNSASASLEFTYVDAPILTILQPANLSFTSISPTTVTGTVNDPTATIVVNSIQAAVVNGAFSVALPLAEGPNTVTAVATSAVGTVGTATLTVTLDTTPPRVTVTSPQDQFVTVESSIDVTGIINDIVVGTVNAEQAGVTVNGVTAQVANRTFLAGNVPLVLGPNVIQVIGRDRVGNQATTQITVARQAPSAQQRIRVLSGNGQSGAIRSVLPAPLAVALTDATGNPAPNKPVIFKVIQNDGLVASGATPAPTVIATTDAQGRAEVQWTLGGRAGAGGNTVEAYSVGFEGTAIFTATGDQGPAGKIVVDTGNNQIGAIGRRLPKPFIAVVVDEGNNRLAGVPVTFTVPEGGGDFEGQPSLTVTSDPDGRVAATLTLGLQEGNNNNLVSATFEGNKGFPAAFTASGRFAGDPAKTTITGVVLDNSNIPIPGVTVRAVQTEALHANGNAANAVPAVQTDAQGQFTIPLAPIGFVKLLVDGSTATPQESYPTLDYDMVTVAGQINTVGQPIFLLPINNANALCVTGTTGGGTLTIPEAPGFSLTFSPGQVTFPGGSKDGCITVTVVNREKVPMAPGFGQQPRFIVTIQPAGAVFNPPAPITLPNVDGLAPRSVTEMYSFDHDISAFIAIGTGIVSDDGLVVRSAAGVGVMKAGWHCGGNPDARGTVADCPPCNFCQAAAPGPGGPDQCVFDASQTACTGGPYNNCIVPGTGACAQDPTPGSYKGICVGGELQPNGTACNAGGSMMAACLDGVCSGTGDQCPASCNDSNACTFDACGNGVCSNQPDLSCQTQCVGKADGTACNAGGTVPGACYNERCTGNSSADQCPATCSANAAANACVVYGCSNGTCTQTPIQSALRIDTRSIAVSRQFSGYSDITVRVAPTGVAGSYAWTTTGMAFDLISPATGRELTSVTLRVNGPGTATVRVVFTADCGIQAEDAVSLVLTPDVSAIGWINGNGIQLPVGASDSLINALSGVGATCAATITNWSRLARGEAPIGLSPPPIDTSEDRKYANAFLLKASANHAPAGSINNDVLETAFIASFGASGDFRSYNRFQAFYVVRNGVIEGSPTELLNVAFVGVTPSPCGPQFIIPGLGSGQAHSLSGKVGVLPNGTVYQVVQGRIGSMGQAVDTYINDQGGNIGATTPWIWFVIRFDINGQLVVPLLHQIFPTYTVYQNGIQIAVRAQGSHEAFVDLNDSNSQFAP